MCKCNELCFVERKVRTLKRELALPSFTVRFLFRYDREFIFSSRAVQNVVNPVRKRERERERDVLLTLNTSFELIDVETREREREREISSYP